MLRKKSGSLADLGAGPLRLGFPDPVSGRPNENPHVSQIKMRKLVVGLLSQGSILSSS